MIVRFARSEAAADGQRNPVAGRYVTAHSANAKKSGPLTRPGNPYPCSAVNIGDGAVEVVITVIRVLIAVVPFVKGGEGPVGCNVEFDQCHGPVAFVLFGVEVLKVETYTLGGGDLVGVINYTKMRGNLVKANLAFNCVFIVHLVEVADDELAFLAYFLGDFKRRLLIKAVFSGSEEVALIS